MEYSRERRLRYVAQEAQQLDATRGEPYLEYDIYPNTEVLAKIGINTGQCEPTYETRYIAGHDSIDEKVESLFEQFEAQADCAAAIDALFITSSSLTEYPEPTPAMLDAVFCSLLATTNPETMQSLIVGAMSVPKLAQRLKSEAVVRCKHIVRVTQIPENTFLHAYLQAYANTNGVSELDILNDLL
ncbi:hypothetical protein EOL96_02630 [Candidatus Saccharibacteria bacterium]|nr:hypothetical protein [Candidatus Saccharibacteria bacterium]